jgi:hypothetical protein
MSAIVVFGADQAECQVVRRVCDVRGIVAGFSAAECLLVKNGCLIRVASFK